MCSSDLALMDLMNFSGDQIETIPCSTFTAKGPTTFGVLRNSFAAATPLGVKFTEGERGGKDASTILLAPADDYVVNADAQLLVIAADISDAQETCALLVGRELALAGVVHAAGVLRDKLIRSTGAETNRMVCAAKALAAFHLRSTALLLPLNMFALFSSWVSIFGSVGQGSYVASNAYMNSLALHQHSSGQMSTSLQLPPINGMGMSASLFLSSSQQLQRPLDTVGLSPDDFAKYLHASLSMKASQMSVAHPPLPGTEIGRAHV